MTPLKHAWHHIRRSPFQSLIAISVMSISFFCLTILFIISQGMSSVLSYFETKPEITIFLKDGLDRDTVESLQKELSTYSGVREIKFISKDKALTIYKEQNKSNPLLTEMVTASILPASFEVSVSDATILQQIAANFTDKKDQIDEIIYQKDIIDSLLSWTNFIRQTGIVTGIVFVVIDLLVIAAIIGLKITNRKDEITISRLLGASGFYVKRPFLLEGLFYGFFGSLIGSITSLGLAFYFYQEINHFFNPITFLSSDPVFYLYLVTGALTTGSFIGYLASYLGANRYIKY